MRLTFVGHASWLIQSGTTALLTDPTLLPTFTSGAWEVSPSRRVRPERLPKLDAVFLSHAHRDHFDVASLALLPRGVRVFCAPDPDILHALARLGFGDVVPAAPWAFQQLGTLELVFTPSNVRFPEVGLLTTDGEATFWNQVDTDVTLGTIERIRQRVGVLDLVAFNYQPMLELAALEAQRTDFPYDAYRRVLHRAALLEPAALVPGSSGERVTGEGAWLNAFKFPVSRERFVRDIGRLLPKCRTFVPNPGDVLEVRGQGTRRRAGAAPRGFVETVAEDDAVTAFDPSAERPALGDEHRLDVPASAAKPAVEWFFAHHLAALVATWPRVGAVHVLGAVLSFRVIYGDGSIEPWVVDFSKTPPAVAAGARPDSDYVLSIGASTLYALVTGRVRLDAVVQSGRYRAFSTAYRVDASGLRSDRELLPPEIHGTFSMIGFLGDVLVPDDQAARRRLDVEIEWALNPEASRARPPCPFWLDEAPREWAGGTPARARSRGRRR